MNNIVYSSDKKVKTCRPDIKGDALDARHYLYREDKRKRKHILIQKSNPAKLRRIARELNRKPSASIWTKEA